MTTCVFCSIVAGELPAHIVWRGTAGVAFLDRRPVFLGHTLVVPPVHVATLTDLAPESIEDFFALVTRVAAAVERGTEAHGTFVAVNNKVSQSVPHLHVHVVPRRRRDGLRGFFWPRRSYGTPSEAAELAAKIRAALPD